MNYGKMTTITAWKYTVWDNKRPLLDIRFYMFAKYPCM